MCVSWHETEVLCGGLCDYALLVWTSPPGPRGVLASIALPRCRLPSRPGTLGLVLYFTSHLSVSVSHTPVSIGIKSMSLVSSIPLPLGDTYNLTVGKTRCACAGNEWDCGWALTKAQEPARE